jgi:CDP-diacylglycerol--glycerol-3-phosphate 3-phosphatidyltransferase
VTPTPSFQIRELLYPANLLTIARLVLVPVILRDLRSREHHRRAGIVLAIALFSDIVDGPIARSRGEVSNVGKVLDPIADKLLLNGAAIAFVRAGRLPRWIAGMLLARDTAILIGSVVIYRRHTSIEMAQPLGKATTVAFGSALLLELLDRPQASRPMFLIALTTMLGSIIQYGRTFLRYLRRN